jgi:RNA polymerase sigma factor (TIGR02999 family)
VKASPGEITVLLAGIQGGDPQAVQELMPLVYRELRRRAAYHMKSERKDHTLQPSALVNEAYVKLAGQPNISFESRAHFFGVAARLMREILIEYARAHRSIKRGGGQDKLPLDSGLVFAPEKSKAVVDLDEALTRLEQRDPRQGRIVELLYFGGLSVRETATVLGISERTVKRDWSFARLWLKRELS